MTMKKNNFVMGAYIATLGIVITKMNQSVTYGIKAI